MTLPIRWWLPAIATAMICAGQTAVTVTAVQNGASFTGRITPGAYATIKGTNFTTAPLSANIVPVPILLGGVTVTVAGMPCPIYYVNPTQINFLLPWNTPIGPYPLIVTANGQTVGPTLITIAAEAPGIFQYGANRAVAQNFNDNYSLNSPTAPAAVGSTLIVYVNGIGMVTNTPPDGVNTPSAPLPQAVYINSATIGGVNAPVTFLGFTPGFVSLGQANVTIPPLPTGDYPLILTVAGLQSTSALVSVKGSASTLPLFLSPLGTLAAATSPVVAPLQGAIHPTANVVVSGNNAYLCDANGIAIIDVSTPASPKYLSNFGQFDVIGAGQGCALYQGDLLASTTALLNVYSLATPTLPQRIAQNQFYFGNTFFSGTTAYVSTQSYTSDPKSFQITAQTGDFYTYDMTNPALPKLDAQLVQNFFQQGSANTSPRGGLTVFNNQTAIVLGTSATNANTNGQALWTTIDVTNPSKPAVLDAGHAGVSRGEYRGSPKSSPSRSRHRHPGECVRREVHAAPGGFLQPIQPSDPEHSRDSLSGIERLCDGLAWQWIFRHHHRTSFGGPGCTNHAGHRRRAESSGPRSLSGIRNRRPARDVAIERQAIHGIERGLDNLLSDAAAVKRRVAAVVQVGSPRRIGNPPAPYFAAVNRDQSRTCPGLLSDPCTVNIHPGYSGAS